MYLTGNVGLEAGLRYTVELDGPVLRVRGPVDSAPMSCVAELHLSIVDATGFVERLVISEIREGTARTFLVFMSLAGGAPEAVADEIVRAATTERGVPT